MVTASQPGAALAPTGHESRSGRARRRLQVLVVDDCGVQCQIAQAMLQHLGAVALSVDNGADAVTLVASRAFDMVLLDCLMPDMDGLETAARIRQLASEQARERPALLVALNGHVTVEDFLACLQGGMDDVLAKPLALQALREIVVEERRRRALPAEAPSLVDPSSLDPRRRPAFEEDASSGEPVRHPDGPGRDRSPSP